MRSSADTAWTSPKSNSRTPRKSNKGKAGSKRTGPATRRFMGIGSHPHWCKRAKLQPCSPAPARTRQAVLSLGGFLGIGEEHDAIPWSMLTYNEKPDGFQLDIAEEQLKNAPKIEQGESWEQADRARNQDVYDYWEVRYYWLVE